MSGRIVAAIIALPIVTSTVHAYGYVRKTTDGGIPEYWQASCAQVTVYTNGFSMMTRDEIAKSIAAAAREWSPGAVACSAGGSPVVEIVTSMAAPDAATPRVAYDGHNALIFRLQDWPIGLEAAVALTTVSARSDGRIVDVDMQINAVFSDWANIDPGFDPTGLNGQNPFDLQNAVTHEFGHLLGFGHTCFSAFSDDVRPIDHLGQPVPDCGDFAPDEVKQTVMYAIVDPFTLETSKRFLSPDEVLGVCDVYPATAAVPACPLDTPNDGCGCATAPDDGSAAATLALLALLVVMNRSRRA